ncbi:MAG TPA: flagellar assembly peptidoglycan hydrolase FlgJ [Burkholderiales bacterium]|nr:flagellar assembly peptidoglycan hydrolase FlgJ [Burkholderiales bacterium]
MTTASATSSLALDPRGLERLRNQAGSSPEKSIREASKQFEVLFVNMLLKSMREASPKDGMLDNEQTKMYTGMLDQQLAQTMANRGIGLADVMARQLSKGGALQALEGAPAAGKSTLPAAGAGLQATPPGVPAAPAAASDLMKPAAAPGSKAKSFIDRMWPHAVDAAKATGLPPHFILGQAALESGWGSREIKTAEGATSHNIFGIKSGRAWKGASADTTTHEFVNGVKQKVVDKFRSYASYAEAFMDYANLLKGNPRYSAVLEAGNDPKAFAQGLQRAGYATDPAYASKLQRIIGSNVMRQSLSA